MLCKQLRAVLDYPDDFKVIVVDDCSPEPAEDVNGIWGAKVSLYRIETDIPWNRGGARNLASHMAETPWLLHVDIDHILKPDCAQELAGTIDSLDPAKWYRFPRYRVGRADETRRKDDLPDGCEFGPIKPHIDSHLMTRELYWKTGGYDEYYSGCLGGGSPFLKRMLQFAPVEVLPEPVHLDVHTRFSVPDASVNDLSRDTSEYSRRRKAKEATGDTTPIKPLNFKWRRVL